MNKIYTHILLICFASVNINLFAQAEKVLQETNRTELLRLAQKWKKERIEKLKLSGEIVKKQGRELRTEDENGEITELQGVDGHGALIFYTTGNLDAARTTSTDKVWPGGGLGFSLYGSSMTIGEWDAGRVRETHQELTGRVSQIDSALTIANHSTHVAGTMIASGVDTSAKGMAYGANLDAYDWNFDNSEMAIAAASGLLISNHSYGYITGWRYNGSANQWQWWGDTTLSGTEDYRFGFYNSSSQAWDQIARNAPYYLIMKSAGNDRGEQGSGTHYLPLHSAFSTTTRPADGGTAGYDCISTFSGAKNILTIGAVNAIPGGYSGPSSVVMSSFSGWGPTDDGRIKPDLVANGVGVYSCLGTNDSAYVSWSGTSMATPSAAGSLLLLQEHYFNENSSYMKAATLKGLAIHTADEAGSGIGPDYKYGWGLLNIARAAQHISDTTGKKSITELNIINGNDYSFNIIADGLTPIRITLSWTDVAGTPVAASLNPSTSMLVNDLDVRVMRNSDSTIYYPYILNPSSPSSAASSGDNTKDNVEQIYISSPASGSYTVIVTHKGNLSGGSSQDFSLIIDGGEPTAQPLNCLTTIQAPVYWNFDTLTNCSSTSGSSCPLPSWYGWQNDTLDDIDWTVRNGSTPSSNTGPVNDYNTGNNTGKYLYTESSTSGTGFPNKQAILYSPCINLDSMTNSELAFAYHMSGTSMGSMSVEIYNGFGWSQIWSATSDQGASWLTASVDISNYDGDTIIIRFVGTTGNSYRSDMAIDAVQIREYKACPDPANLAVSNITDTTAELFWTSSASYWRIRLDLKDSTTLVSPTTINFNPVIFINLQPGTAYDIYLQDSCGGGDTSNWVGPITFTTDGCNPNPVSISNLGQSTYCAGDSTTLLSSAGASYQWYRYGIPIFGDTSINLIVKSSGIYNVLVTDSNSCSDSSVNPVTITVNSNPVVTIISSSLPAFCFGDSTTLTTISGVSFQWYKDGNLLNGATLPNFLALDSGLYNVVVTDSNNCSDSAYSPLTIQVFPLPIVTITALGDTVFCDGDSVLLSIGQGFTQYQWYWDGVPVIGINNFELNVKNEGNYNVYVTNSNNCSDSAKLGKSIKVNNLPLISISPTDSSICDGDSVIITATPGYSYQWRKNGVPISGAFTSTFIAREAGSYNVVATSASFCSDTAGLGSKIVILDLPVVSLDPQPDLCNTTGSTLLSGGLPFGGAYSGATVSETSGQYFFEPGASGIGTFDITYTFTDSNSCRNSDIEPLLVKNCVGIASISNEYELVFYPNPTEGMLYVSVPVELKGKIDVRVFDLSGQLVYNKSFENYRNTGLVEIDLENQANGSYFVQLQLGDKVWKQKVILGKN